MHLRICAAFLALTGLAIGSSQAANLHHTVNTTNTCRHLPALGSGDQSGRTALIVGNAQYTNGIPILRNPVKDVDAVASTLGKMGFNIYVATDAKASTIADCAQRMKDDLTPDGIALVYYSGHGIQIDDRNYMVAVDAKPDGDVANGYVYIDDIIENVTAKASTALIFLDACRNNPFASEGSQGLSVSTGRGLNRGLKRANAEEQPGRTQGRGILVAYSTSPNAVANDGSGDLSPFTEAFVASIATPGYSVQRALSEVTNRVGEATDWQQTPWIKSSLSHEVKLSGGLTFEEAVSLSENHAGRSKALLDRGDVNGAIIEALRGLPENVNPAEGDAFFAAYAALFAATRSSNVRLDVPSDTKISVTSHSGSRRLATQPAEAGGAALQLWDMDSGKLLAAVGRTRKDRLAQRAPLFSGDGSLVLAERGGGEFFVANTLTGAILHKFSLDDAEPAGSRTYTFGATNSLAVFSGGEQTLQIFDVHSGEKTLAIKLTVFKKNFPTVNIEDSLNGFAKVVGGKRIVFFAYPNTAFDHRTTIFGSIDPSTGDFSETGTYDFRAASNVHDHYLLSKNGNYLAVNYLDENYATKYVIIDLKRKLVLKENIFGGWVYFSPDSSFFITHQDKTSLYFSTRSGLQISPPNIIAEEHPPGVYSRDGIHLSMSMSHLNFGESFVTDTFWKLPDGKNLRDVARERLLRSGIVAGELPALAFRTPN